MAVETQGKNTFRCIALALLVALCFSVVLVSHHIDHECTGTDCPVCAVVEAVRAQLHSFRACGSTVMHSRVAFFTSLAFFVLAVPVIFLTPVAQKIRLNN